MPDIHRQGVAVQIAQLGQQQFITDDGVVLPFKTWRPAMGENKVVLIAIHGFNDYSQFFDLPGQYLSQRGIITYAYDQRGFGASDDPGYWAGVDTYVQDLLAFTQLVKRQHPDLPIYILGESMGGAVVAVAFAQTETVDVDGIILAAPAVWSRSTMPWYQRSLLWSLAHTMPWLTLTGEGVDVTPSDNIEMLRALGRDPKIIKATRVEAMYGLANLMDAAYASAEQLKLRLLFLYGDKDDIIPPEPVYQFISHLHGVQQTIAFYPNSYHMLLRDLQREILLNDIIAWINHQVPPLPSGADYHAKELLSPVAKSSGDHRVDAGASDRLPDHRADYN